MQPHGTSGSLSYRKPLPQSNILPANVRGLDDSVSLIKKKTHIHRVGFAKVGNIQGSLFKEKENENRVKVNKTFL